MIIPHKKIVAHYLKEQRKILGMSLRDIAKGAGIKNHNTILSLEQGGNCKYENYYKLLEFYRYYGGKTIKTNCDPNDHLKGNHQCKYCGERFVKEDDYYYHMNDCEENT